MPKQKQPTSVHTIVSNLDVDHEHTFENKSIASVSVMVSQLKKKEEHKHKKFKVHSKEGSVLVKRVF